MPHMPFRDRGCYLEHLLVLDYSVVANHPPKKRNNYLWYIYIHIYIYTYTWYAKGASNPTPGTSLILNSRSTLISWAEIGRATHRSYHMALPENRVPPNPMVNHYMSYWIAMNYGRYPIFTLFSDTPNIGLTKKSLWKGCLSPIN